MGSRVPNLKELRAGSVRVLFAFDPRRNAILPVGGDKRGRWSRWYDEWGPDGSRSDLTGVMIPAAERAYARHVEELARRERRRDG